MCSANAVPYSNSNSSDPLFSVDNAVTYPCSIAWRRIPALNSSSTRIPGARCRHALAKRLLESLIDHLLAVGDDVVFVRSQRWCEWNMPVT